MDRLLNKHYKVVDTTKDAEMNEDLLNESYEKGLELINIFDGMMYFEKKLPNSVKEQELRVLIADFVDKHLPGPKNCYDKSLLFADTLLLEIKKKYKLNFEEQ